MIPIPLDETLRETLPAKWNKGGGPLGNHRAYLDVYGCRVLVVRNPATPSEEPAVGVAEDGLLPVRFPDIIDAVVECVRRAVHAERPVHAADVPEWAHREVVKAQGSIMQSGPPWALYEALVREIVGGRFPPPWAAPPR